MRSGFGLRADEVDDWIGEVLEATRDQVKAAEEEFAAEIRASRQPTTEEICVQVTD